MGRGDASVGRDTVQESVLRVTDFLSDTREGEREGYEREQGTHADPSCGFLAEIHLCSVLAGFPDSDADFMSKAQDRTGNLKGATACLSSLQDMICSELSQSIGASNRKW